MSTFMLELRPITLPSEDVVASARRATDLEATLRRALASVAATAVSIHWAYEEGATTAIVQYDASHLVDAAIRHSLSVPGSPFSVHGKYRLFTAGDFAAHMEVAAEASAA